MFDNVPTITPSLSKLKLNENLPLVKQKTSSSNAIRSED